MMASLLPESKMGDVKNKYACQLTDKELSDKEYVRAYISSFNEDYSSCNQLKSQYFKEKKLAEQRLDWIISEFDNAQDTSAFVLNCWSKEEVLQEIDKAMVKS